MERAHTPPHRESGGSSGNDLRMMFVGIVAALCGFVYSWSPWHDYLEEELLYPLFFKARSAANLGPELDERLRIYSFDDTTLTTLGAADLSFKQWTDLIVAIDKRRPRAIVIDKIFAVPPVGDDPSLPLLGRLNDVTTPLFTLAHVAAGKLPGRLPMPLTSPRHQLRTYYASPMDLITNSRPQLATRFGWHVYGPGQPFNAVFHNVGHALNAVRGRFLPVVRVGPAEVVPHVSMLGGEPLKIAGGRLWSDGIAVPVDDAGRAMVDFVNPKSYYQHARRLSGVLQAVGQQRDIKEINAGDVVLILPSMFTGNTDFTVTPVGELPGGFVLASIINSRLRGAWLQSFDWPVAAPALAAVIGVLIVVSIGRLALVSAFFACGLWITVVFVAFAQWGAVLSLTTPVFTLAVAVGYGMADRTRFAQRFQRLFLTLKAEHTELERELDEAAMIAAALLPAKVPAWEGLSISTFHRPLSKTSGDWFAFEASPTGRRLHYFMCDIVGHGVQAAIIASTCRSVLSMLILADPDTLEDEGFILRYASTLNRVLHENAAGAHTTTLLALSFDRETGTVTCVAAGHPRPIYIGAAAQPLLFGTSGNPLGLFAENEWQLTQQQLHPGDAIVAHTDGVPLPHRLSVLAQLVAEAGDGSDYSRAERLTRAAWSLHSARRGPAEQDDASLAWFKRVA